MGYLRIISDHLEGIFELPEKTQKLGRGNDCDIQLPHRSVSRHHCIVTRTGDRLRVEDLGSSFGTFVNGTQINEGEAVEGDKVRIGRVVLVFESVLSQSSVIAMDVLQAEELPIAEAVPVAKQAPAAPSPPAKAPPPSPPAPVRAATSIPAPQAPPAVKKPTPPGNAPKLQLSPAVPDTPRASQKKKVSQPIKPVLAKKAPAPAPQKTASAPPKDEGEASKITESGDEDPGVFNNIGGRKRGKKPKRHDYRKEASAWEKKADALTEGEGAPDYAGEADEWDEVWGKQRNHKSFRFPGGGLIMAMLGVFGGFNAKFRMIIVVGIMAGIAYAGKFGYDKATSHVLVPIKKGQKGQKGKKAAKPRTNPSTGLAKGDEVLDNAVDTFKKIIPKELQGKD